MNNKTLLKHIFTSLFNYRFRLLLALMSLLIVVACILALGLQIQNFIDNKIISGENFFIVITIIILLFGIASFTRSYIINSTAEFAATDIKNIAFSNLLDSSSENIDKYEYSDLATRINSDSEAITRIIIDITSFYVRNFLTTIGGIIFMFLTSSQLSMVTFLIITIISIIATFISKYVRRLARIAEEAKQKASNIVFEAIINNKVIAAMAEQNNIKSHFEEVMQNAKDKIAIRLKFRSIFFATVVTAMMFSITIIIWYGSYEVAKGNMTSGQLASFLFYAFLASLSFGGLIEMMSDLQKNLASCERVFELINNNVHSKNSLQISNNFNISTDPTKENSNLDNLKNIESLNQQIEFNDISYKYPNSDKFAIENINLQINANNFTVISGRSGKGKTTILNILMGLYNPGSGLIKIDNKEYKNLNSKYWQNIISYVPQENLLFSGTIAQNISFFNPSYDSEFIYQILDGLELKSFVQNLPNKLETELGSLAGRLSGGQRQRIAIARAIYKRPKILILDEATSQLDEETEKKVLDYLISLKSECTIICVAHRKAAIARANYSIKL